MLTQSISKNSLILAAFALVTAGILALTFMKTAPRIADAEKRAAQQALLEIVPDSRHDNDMLHDIWQIPEEQLMELGLSAQSNIHIARLNDAPVAFIVPATAKDGYSGDIKMIIGVNVDGSIAGVRVLSHKETPGLGDRVDLNKSPWVLSFNGKSLQQPQTEKWKVKKDGGEFDQFTGATITPRAVVHQVKQTLEFFERNKSALLEQSPTQAASSIPTESVSSQHSTTSQSE
ncbi:Electron transport complex subunit RnfG [Thalassocella blandensis]|nr:Electron transport complex subunit RnfG [Thalassocella blandensis]